MIRSKLAIVLLSSTALMGVTPAVAGVQTPKPVVSIPRNDPAPQSAALPAGGKVASGSASITQSSSTQTDITQTSQTAIINWQEFSIGKGNTVKVTQPNATSALLNRVTGYTTSTLAGTLTANGKVYLINPNGITITSTGKVQAAAFTASTLDISDSDFKAGKLTFKGKGASAAVTNQGTISVASGGYVALMGGSVSNSGLIVAPLGKVGLGSGEAMTLDVSGDGFLQVAVPSNAKGEGALVANSGSIKAQGGTVVMTAAAARTLARQAVNLTGVIEATSVSGHNGAIRLSGGEGQVAISGTLKATSDTATGGSITVTGRDIVLSQASLDASGKTAGGTILIGGNAQGQGALPHADTVAIDANSTLKANATTSGNGGNIIAWSDGQTTAHGAFEAKALSGQGGTVETSGAFIDVSGVRVDTSSIKGQAGTWLIDPTDLTVDAAAAATISTNLATTNVTLQTDANGTTTGPGNTSSGAGDIVINSGISWSSNKVLTLNGYHALKINAPINILGAGGLALNYDASNVMNLAFNGPGTVDYGVVDKGGTLSVNNIGYTLAYTLNQLDAIDGQSAIDGSTVGKFGDGATGAFALATNLDASSTVYTHGLIGYSGQGGVSFGGKFEGLGHTVSNLTINAPTLAEIGLFGEIMYGTIRDIGVVNANVTARSAAGGLVGFSVFGGYISNAYATGNVTVTEESAGGLIGAGDTTTSNSYADVTVNGRGYVGGLIGQHFSGYISNSHATGDANGSTFVGGLVGAFSSSAVYIPSGLSSSYATGNVTSVNGSAGGLVGGFVSTLSTSYATGNVTSGGTAVGGLVGQNNGAISNSYATGQVTGNYQVGGLLGRNDNNGSIINSFWDVTTTGQVSAIGGQYSSKIADIHALTGSQAWSQSAYSGWDFSTTWVMADGYTRPFLISEKSNYITNIHQLQLMGLNLAGNYKLSADIDASATSSANGMWRSGFVPVGNDNGSYFGTFDGAGHKITNLTIDSKDFTQSGLFGVLGTVGQVRNVSLSYGTALSGQTTFGGLVGSNYGSVRTATTSAAISLTAPVTGSSTVGALVGANYGSIVDSHASGSLVGDGTIGGLVGVNGSAIQSGTIVQSTANVDIVNSSITGATGGLVGYNRAGSISQSFAKAKIDGKYNVGGLVGFNEAAVSQSYAAGAAKGINQVGGLVGSANWTSVNGQLLLSSIDQSYSTTYVIGNNNVGGLVGYNSQYTTISNSYFDILTSGQSAGVGSDGAGQTVTGLSTAQFQSGVLPTGLNSTAWATGANLYPYLKTLYKNGVQAITGFAYSDLDATKAASKGVGVISNGKVLGFNYSGANGYFYTAFDAGLVASGTNNLLVYTDTGISVADASGATSQSVDVYSNYIKGATNDLQLSTGLAALKSAALATAGNSAQAQDLINNGAGLWLTAKGPSFVVDAATGAPKNLFIQTGTDAPLSVNAPLTVENNASLALTSGGSLTVNEPIAVKGSGYVRLAYKTAPQSGKDLLFANSGAVTFKAADGSATTVDVGGKLSLNGQNYGLIYNASDLDQINGNLAGNYALARNISLLGMTYGRSVIASTGTFDGAFEGLGHNISSLNIVSNASNLGFFGTIGSLGSVHGLSLEAYVNGDNTSWNVGGVAGENRGRITQVGASGGASGHGSVGLIVGWNNGGWLESDVTWGNVSADFAYVGGAVGYNSSGTLKNIFVNGNVGGLANEMGGVVGHNENGQVLSVGIDHYTVVGGDTNWNVGGIVGVNNGNGVVSDAWANNTVRGYGSVGGLVGWNNGGTVDASYAIGPNVTGQFGFVGGAVGYNLNGIVKNTLASFVQVNAGNANTNEIGGLIGHNEGGSVTADRVEYSGINGGTNSWNVGGLVGYNHGVVSASNVDANVTGYGTVGGLVGWNDGGSVATSNYTSGTVSGTYAYIGGGIGFNWNGTISGSTSAGSVQGMASTSEIGGLVGHNQDGTISNSHSSATVSGAQSWNLGGLVGVNNGSGSVTGSYATGAVSGEGSVGGLVGWNNGGSISTSYATGTAYASSLFAGGLVGYNNGTIQVAYATGAVSGSSVTNDLGGLVGQNENGLISQSYATGTVTGGANSWNVGGLAGVNTGTGQISDTYAGGTVAGLGNAGGLVGQNNGTATITTSYSTGLVNSSINAGGLVGWNNAMVTGSYWDVNSSGKAQGIGVGNLTGATAKTSAELTSGVLPSGFASTIWSATVGNYPSLKALP